MADRDISMAEARDRRADFNLDASRKHLLWLALGLISLLSVAFVLTVAYGQEIISNDYNEPLMLIGLLAMLTCTVAYFADKERDHRAENRRLIRRLQETAEALDARVGRLNKLCETSALLTGNLDIQRISDLVVEALVAQVQADAASLVLVDKAAGECLHTRSVWPLAQADDQSARPDAIARAAAGDSGPAIRSVDNSVDITRQLQAWADVRAAISAPLKVSEVIGGALAAMRHDEFSAEDLNLLTTLANMASKAIESAELHEELRQSYFKTLHVLARSLAARDPYSAAHGEAVTLLAHELAETLGLGDDAVEALRAYGPLHDLGKIGIPDSVLLKHGALTDEERDLCRQHTVIGQEIMRPLNPGQAILCMIRAHHEAWDGSGYPDGLRGEQIPALARVLAVADSFDAIVSHRSYRAGATPFDAVQEIEAMAGIQFDPDVVRALRHLWESGELAKLSMGPQERAEGHAILNIPAALSAPPAASVH